MILRQQPPPFSSPKYDDTDFESTYKVSIVVHRPRRGFGGGAEGGGGFKAATHAP
jgi:hypothetical protein